MTKSVSWQTCIRNCILLHSMFTAHANCQSMCRQSATSSSAVKSARALFRGYSCPPGQFHALLGHHAFMLQYLTITAQKPYLFFGSPSQKIYQFSGTVKEWIFITFHSNGSLELFLTRRCEGTVQGLSGLSDQHQWCTLQ